MATPSNNNPAATLAEATRFDVTVKDGTIADYRVRLNISFKYESGD